MYAGPEKPCIRSATPPRSTAKSVKLSASTFFQSQYQQNPTSREGGLIKREWLRYYEPQQRPKDFFWVLQSWDTANKCGDMNDYSVCATWRVCDADFYLIDVFRKRLTYPQLKRAATELFKKYAPFKVLIKDKASGTALIQELKSDYIYCVEEYKPAPGSDKVMRLGAQSIKFENGRIYLPKHAPWLDEYVSEITSFPGGKHDDQVDSTSQALEILGPMAGSPDWRPFCVPFLGYENY